MKKQLRNMVLAATTAILALSSVSTAFACTGVYVGKQVSTDGTTIIARSVDTHPLASPCLTVVVDRVENEPGRVFQLGNFTWDLPDTTYKYTSTPFSTGLGGGYSSACANEKGLAITGTVTAYISSEISAMDPPVRGGTALSEFVLPELVAMQCATAREGVELLGKVIAEKGNSEQNIIMLADKDEAWYMETYTGHQWCAVKMPEDCVAVFGNEFMITAIDPDSPDVMYSEGLFTMPEEAGLAQYLEDGSMDIFSTYSGKGRLANYANRRTWYGHVLLAPETAGEYGTYTKYDLFYEPAKKVSLIDVFEVLRARFEGTQWNPEDTGRLDQRVIGTETQAESHALQVYSDLPEEMRVVTWNCVANSEHSVYLPISNLITDTAEAYKYDPEEYGYDPGMAAICFKRLCALSEQDRTYYGAGVRAYWHAMEEELVASYPEVLAELATKYAADPEEAKAYITDYTVNLQNKALEDANTMYDELTWYMIQNTDTLHYSFSYGRLTMSDTLTQKPFVPSLAAVEE